MTMRPTNNVDAGAPATGTPPVTTPPSTGGMQTEPAVIIGSITAVVTAILALLVAFGMDISPDQQAAILGMVAAVAPIVAAVFIRQRVFSPATTQRIANQAAETAVANVPTPPAK